MASVENTRERQGAVLADVAAHLGSVGLDLGVAGFAEILADLGLDGEADLFTAVPFSHDVSKRGGLTVVQ